MESTWSLESCRPGFGSGLYWFNNHRASYLTLLSLCKLKIIFPIFWDLLQFAISCKAFGHCLARSKHSINGNYYYIQVSLED